MKTLVIAEKPSVAADVAHALGGFQKSPGYFESDDMVITFARGHLVKMEASRDPGYNLAALPVIPSPFDLAPTDNSVIELLKNIDRLAKRKDINRVINACDAGREGELIFRLIVAYLGITHPTERAWLQSMTANGIRSAFQNLRPEIQMRPLFHAARCRAEADWLIGINGTRVMTMASGIPIPRGEVVSVGRVQTPTLGMVVQRENEILAFTPKDFYEVVGTFGVTNGRWDAKLLQAPISGDADDPNLGEKEEKSTRFWNRQAAQAAVAACQGKNPTRIEDQKSRTKRHAPLPFDLTTLQRVANTQLGMTAADTLKTAQALYEQHKVTTYPRTDSCHLPSDYAPKVLSVLKLLAPPHQPHAQQILQAGWVTPEHPVFNDKKVSDHFAIIPTGVQPKGLSATEQHIYDLIVSRFMAAFFPAAQYDQTIRLTWIEDKCFRARGKVLVDPGWTQVYEEPESDTKKKTAKPDVSLPLLVAAEQGITEKVSLSTGKTKAPPRFTEATLLSAMETAGKMVDDQAFSKAMSERGLGTPATRASIIEELLSAKKGYLTRNKKELRPTPKAHALINALKNFELTFLADPGLTGEWEHKLKLIEEGAMSPKDYMLGINNNVVSMVERVRG
jgi:DNA topoisomerase-3